MAESATAKHTPRVVLADFEDPRHAEAIVTVLDTYARDPVGAGRPLGDDVRQRLVHDLSKLGYSVVLLAFEPAGEPVGIAICFYGYSTFQARPLLNIHDLAVTPPWRGRGVGRALLIAAEEHAVTQGCCKLTLEVQDDNSPALGLYRSFGFGDFFIAGATHRTVFLQKALGD
jgi:ribosomal protein S18 acetylase RimI-like enzyme